MLRVSRMCVDRFSFTSMITAARSEFSTGNVYEASRSGIFINAVIRACASFKQRFNFYHCSWARNRILRKIVQIIMIANMLIEPWVYANFSRMFSFDPFRRPLHAFSIVFSFTHLKRFFLNYKVKKTEIKKIFSKVANFSFKTEKHLFIKVLILSRKLYLCADLYLRKRRMW